MSSGNLTADRRFAYAQELRREGDARAAADLIAQALELAPHWLEGCYTLAETLMEAGETTGAVDAFLRYLDMDPADSMGATLKLAQLGARPAPAIMPPAFVRRLFDDYAATFDNALVKSLHYVAPQLLRAAVVNGAPGKRFLTALDLGCGTGLAGLAFRPLVEFLEGVDLSPRMAAEANAKGVYNAMAVTDIMSHLGGTYRKYDLVIASDVFCYFGDLAGVFTAVRKVMMADGLFAFSLQRRDGAENFVLGPERRFSHSHAYVGATAEQTGFDVMALGDGTFRRDGGADVPGLLAVLRPAQISPAAEPAP